MRTQHEVAEFFENSVIPELRRLHSAGQREYAIEDDNSFRNFEAIANELGLDRKLVLWVYAKKHIDGIVSYLRGHISQREDVRGRIADLMIYLVLLWAMIQSESEA